MVKISVITWDGGFREFFHTVDCFANQTFLATDYEFIWVEYYNSAKPELVKKIDHVDNAKILCLSGEGKWHAGRCMNAGIAASSGELLVIVDGDIVVKPDFLEKIWQTHRECNDLVLYVRRWDEPEREHTAAISIQHLETACRLNNPTNYGGCLSTRRKTVEIVEGYEEHPIIGGVGAVSKEMYTRLCNAGLPIMWHPTEKVFHPWHPGTLPSTNTRPQQMQAWVINQRGMNLDIKADARQIESYLTSFSEYSRPLRKIKRFLRKLPVFNSLRRWF